MSFKVCLNDKKKLHIVLDMGHVNSKIFMIPCIGTSCLENDYCAHAQKHSTDRHICHYCYAKKSLKRYPALNNCLVKNTEILTRRLTDNEINVIAEQMKIFSYIRFESHGDLNNEKQFLNYCDIAKKCENTNFCLFTKHLEFVKKYAIPKNLSIVYSNPWIDDGVAYLSSSTPYLNNLKKITGIDHIFTVYENRENISSKEFKCQKQCFNCLHCWKKTDKIEFIGEQLK